MVAIAALTWYLCLGRTNAINSLHTYSLYYRVLGRKQTDRAQLMNGRLISPFDYLSIHVSEYSTQSTCKASDRCYQSQHDYLQTFQTNLAR